MSHRHTYHLPRPSVVVRRLRAVCLFALALLGPMAASAEDGVDRGTLAAPVLDNAACQQCHDGRETHKVPDRRLYAEEGDMRELTAITPERFAAAVHGGMQCVTCHRNITDLEAPHQTTETHAADCAGCHQALWETALRENTLDAHPRLAVVAANLQAYRESFHARDNVDDPSHVNATCDACHDTHFFNVPTDKSSPAYAAWRLGIPAICGKCHEEQLESYTESVHGSEIIEQHNADAAVCTDCHTTHEITGTSLTRFKLLNPEECGACHEQNLQTYRDTYHGQVSNLGDTRTAKCYDCHGSHDILRIDDPESMVAPENRLETCQQCHDGKKMPLATRGFLTFGPHAHAGDRERYPELWFASRFMLALLVGVFAFFWLHSGLWYYREWKDRQEGRTTPLVQTGALDIDVSKHIRRFPAGWRLAHLVFAIVTMTLVLTGITAMYAHTSWAPMVARLFGSARNLALVHHIAAAIFLGIFFAHFVYVMQKLLRTPGFRWFGPDSLVPNWKDLKDCWGMFRWFIGKGPKPLFDRWAYFEKFDYWAVFWGVTIIGMSGLMLAFPHITAHFLPGWVFNVATLVHGEEAFLAAVFLFTVHFFNNHFRPDKLPPPDIVMFTGTQSLEEFRRDHPAHYLRLLESGELEKHLVDGPSTPMKLASVLLGLALITLGLGLLLLVAIGFFTTG